MTLTRRLITAATLLVAVGLAAACGSPAAPSPPPPPATPDATAAAFAAAYASGDTIAACKYAGGEALKDFTIRGICDHSAGWSSGYSAGSSCPHITSGDFAGEHGYSYDTTTEVAGHRGFWIIVSGSGDTWTVNYVGTSTRLGWCAT
jgi:hypothetical protein